MSRVLEEYDVGGTAQADYVYGYDLISQQRGGDVRFYHRDGQVSTRLLSDAAGQITDAYDYDAFGNVLNSVGATENMFGYTGEQTDASTGLAYLRALRIRLMGPVVRASGGNS